MKKLNVPCFGDLGAFTFTIITAKCQLLKKHTGDNAHLNLTTMKIRTE